MLALAALAAAGACAADDTSSPGGTAPDAGRAGGSAGSGGAAGSAGAGPADAAPVADAGPRAPAGRAPADLTAEGISAFLKAGEHTKGSWISETPASRERSTSVSPHGDVRVWMNDLMVASLRAGKSNNVGAPPAERFSMVVKELHDADSKALVGRAVMLKADEGTAGASWIYYCYGPAGRCFGAAADRTIDNPYFGRGMALSCGGCHGGLVFTKPPAP
jgi:hypothetical protein